ncbi:NUDIX hydrolase [Clostridium sp. DL-VIII]|uniref:NUDIX hydrolase n=1 Tax=Clostridium sp. DL-VIII TaxID=641107 RepID=UPI00023AFBB8|nr:NUDIX pyrophosphatase [Clostridium sp. DL-VIII]EHI99482.1 NUDIX hydrolase [Clostridium sp. DL-VIII]
MGRAKYQVLVIPYIIQDNIIKYAVFHRSDMQVWQFIAGGGEDGETPLQSAKREAFEEASISTDNNYYHLETSCSISTECFKSYRSIWGEDCLVIPEYTFAVNVETDEMILSNEHTDCQWMDYKTAKEKLRYDSNKVALWEVDNKIKMRLLD